MTPQEKLDKLEAVLKLVDESLTREEFVDAFAEVVKLIQELKKGNAAHLSTLTDSLNGFAEKLRAGNSKDFESTRNECMDLIDAALKDQQNGMNFIYDKVRNLKDGKPGDKGDKGDTGDSIVGPQGIPGPAGSPDTGEDIVKKINSADSLIKSEAIEGLDNLITAGVNRVQTPAKAYKVHIKDCSAQCDGANKTFTVGGTHVGIMGVFGTQFPLIYRPVIDYTETATGFVLTSTVAAPESGQTLIAQFLK